MMTGVRRGMIVAMLALPCWTSAQQLPAVRQVGRLERVTSDSLASVSEALAMRDGRVMVHDRIGRRVMLFDSTLAHPSVVADTTGLTANAYGGPIARLIWFRADSMLLIDASSLSMAVIDPHGKLGRMMAIPRAEDAQAIASSAGIDDSGHLVYFNALGSLPGFAMLGIGDAVYTDGKPTNLALRFNSHTDSAWLIRVDLGTRMLDSLTPVHIPKLDRVLKADERGGLTSIVNTPDPVPVVDDWTVLRDGTVAVVRGRDYHIDWFNRAGKSSSPRLPFDWEKLDDARKQALIDSTVARWQSQYDGIMSGRGGRGPIPGLAPLVAARPSMESLPAYAPPLATLIGGGPPTSSDAEGNVWIRTTKIIDGRPVYDVVNRRGELFDRVQLPPFRTIAGFGPGVIYMAMKDATGRVHLERARIR
jgi:hypothetical protein